MCQQGWMHCLLIKLLEALQDKRLTQAWAQGNTWSKAFFHFSPNQAFFWNKALRSPYTKRVHYWFSWELIQLDNDTDPLAFFSMIRSQYVINIWLSISLNCPLEEEKYLASCNLLAIKVKQFAHNWVFLRGNLWDLHITRASTAIWSSGFQMFWLWKTHTSVFCINAK